MIHEQINSREPRNERLTMGLRVWLRIVIMKEKLDTSALKLTRNQVVASQSARNVRCGSHTTAQIQDEFAAFSIFSHLTCPYEVTSLVETVEELLDNEAIQVAEPIPLAGHVGPFQEILHKRKKGSFPVTMGKSLAMLPLPTGTAVDSCIFQQPPAGVTTYWDA